MRGVTVAALLCDLTDAKIGRCQQRDRLFLIITASATPVNHLCGKW